MKAYFDPGGACAGYAIFEGSGLVECGLSRTKAKDLGQRARDHRARVRARLNALGPPGAPILAEMMWHRGPRARGVPPQDLINTNLIAGHVGTEWVLPHTWKGMVPKEIHQPKILAALSKEELALIEQIMPKSLRHNAIDAVGIGLYDVGRLGAREAKTCKRIKKKIAEATKSGRRGGPKSPAFVTLPKGALRASKEKK